MTYWWEPAITKMPDMSLKRADRGGFVRVSWGSIGFAPNAFTGEPPAKAQIALDWGLVSSSLLHFFDGTIVRRGLINREGTYDLYEPEYDTKLLDEGTDESGNTVYKPLVMGTVNHMSPQRTGTDTEYRYYKPDFAGTPNYYDDGVLIPDHWTDHGDGTISRSVALVGTLTMSGTGNKATLADLFSWAATRMGLTLKNVHGADEEINCVAYNQDLLVNYLDKVVYYCGYMFYVLDDVICLVSMDNDNGEQTVDKRDVEVEYQWQMPVKKYTATWTTKVFNPATVQLDDEEHEYIKYPDHAVGEEVVINNLYDELEAKVQSRIDAIAARDVLVRVKLALPLDQLPPPGEKIIFTDSKGNNDISGYFRVMGRTINHASKTLDVEGDGEITFA